VGGAELGGARYIAKRFTLSGKLPYGYHRLNVEAAGRCCQSLVISTSSRAFGFDAGKSQRSWGVFLPLYAAHSQRSWGAGDYSDLESLATWVGELGGDVVATLPLLCTFLDEPFEPSPYTPVSRLMWNEFYIDVTRLPEMKKSASAQALLESTSVQRDIAMLRESPLVDYKRQMVLKRRVLEVLCRCLFSESSSRLESLQGFVRTHPAVEEYARFRSTLEQRRAPWPSWPQRLRKGQLQKGDYDESTSRYYLYAQWAAQQQVQALLKKAGNDGAKLCLDFPLGVHPHGYDVWRNQNCFVLDVRVGAPPDAVFTAGQDWESPPLHPEKIREQGYGYFIACLRHHMRFASILRIDHVMGLHRLFWIPHGMEPEQGVYVRYPTDDLYAIIALESHRNEAIIEGEDLGTVPPYIRPAMKRHGLYRSYVLQYELSSDSGKGARTVPSRSVASINTHDMPPFAAYWQGFDIEQRMELGLLDRATSRHERKEREFLKRALVKFLQRRGFAQPGSDDPKAILIAILAFLSASQAQLILVNLEDLWLETEAQNMPGTSDECPNWRRKSRYPVETLFRMPEVVDILQEVDRLRKGAPW
jgi:4-alpha-glucanotransferase